MFQAALDVFALENAVDELRLSVAKVHIHFFFNSHFIFFADYNDILLNIGNVSATLEASR